MEKYHGLAPMCSTELTHTSGCGGFQDCHKKRGGVNNYEHIIAISQRDR